MVPALGVGPLRVNLVFKSALMIWLLRHRTGRADFFPPQATLSLRSLASSRALGIRSSKPSLYPDQVLGYSQGNQGQVGSQGAPGLVVTPQFGAESGHTHHARAGKTGLGLPEPWMLGRNRLARGCQTPRNWPGCPAPTLEKHVVRLAIPC